MVDRVVGSAGQGRVAERGRSTAAVESVVEHERQIDRDGRVE